MNQELLFQILKSAIENFSYAKFYFQMLLLSSCMRLLQYVFLSDYLDLFCIEVSKKYLVSQLVHSWKAETKISLMLYVGVSNKKLNFSNFLFVIWCSKFFKDMGSTNT